MTLYDNPNQQVVRGDGSGPVEEGEGGSERVDIEPVVEAEPEGDLMALTKAELLARAEAVGAEADESMTKAEIAETIGG